jgi:cytochrome P450
MFFLTEHEVVETKHSDEVVRDSIIGFKFAAYETTSVTLSWFFLLLSKNPRVGIKIREELVNNFPVKEGKKWELRSKEELSELVYLHAALCEVLRLYSPIPFQHRTLVKPDILPGGHHVNPNIRIIISGLSGLGSKEDGLRWNSKLCVYVSSHVYNY